MGEIYWRFAKLDGGPSEGYTSNDIEGFKGVKLVDNLVREICQNSLDARAKLDLPVKVVFKVENFLKNDYKVFSAYGDCINACRKCWKNEMDDRLREFIEGAEDTLKGETIPLLIASDYNTTGARESHSNKKSSMWAALTSSDGVSQKADNNSAGSYGIGKNVSFACSSLSMVFYNTFADDGESAFIGVARLASLLINGEETRKTGQYQYNDEQNADKKKRYRPIYSTDEDNFRDKFKRDTVGTDVIIAGFTEMSGWIKKFKKAVLKNFLVAICEGNLVVELKDDNNYVIIDSNTIEGLFNELAGEMTECAQIYEAFTNPEFKESFSILEPDDVDMFVKSDRNYRNSIAQCRSAGMLIKTRHIDTPQSYASVIIVRGDKLGCLLRMAEPARHDRWDCERIKKMDLRLQAQEALAKMNDSVKRFLKLKFEASVIENEIDAIGALEYLPADTGESEGEDILNAEIEIILDEKNKPDDKYITKISMEESGAGESDFSAETETDTRGISIQNNRNHGESGTQDGGITAFSTLYSGEIKAYQLSENRGIYRIVVIPRQSYKNMYIECFAVGEDSTEDSLDMENFEYNGKRIPITAGKAGPVEVAADIPAIFIAVFAQKEKMLIRVKLTEEIRR